MFIIRHATTKVRQQNLSITRCHQFKLIVDILYNVLDNDPTSVVIVQPLLLREVNVTHLTAEGIPITSQQKIKTRFCRPLQKFGISTGMS